MKEEIEGKRKYGDKRDKMKRIRGMHVILQGLQIYWRRKDKKISSTQTKHTEEVHHATVSMKLMTRIKTFYSFV